MIVVDFAENEENIFQEAVEWLCFKFITSPSVRLKSKGFLGITSSLYAIWNAGLTTPLRLLRVL